MTPTFVQACGGFSSATVDSINGTFASPVTIGNLLIASWYSDNNGQVGGTPTSVPITHGAESWSLDQESTTNILVSVNEYVGMGHTLATSTGTTITFAPPTTGQSGLRFFCHEVSGVDTIDASLINNATSATASTGNVGITHQAIEYVFAMFISENGTSAPSGGTTRATEGSEISVDTNSSSTGTVTITASAGGSNQWAVVSGSFYLAAGGGTLSIGVTGDTTASSESVSAPFPSPVAVVN